MVTRGSRRRPPVTRYGGSRSHTSRARRGTESRQSSRPSCATDPPFTRPISWRYRSYEAHHTSSARSRTLIPPWVGVAHRWTQTRSMMVWITPVPCRVNPRRRRQRSCDEWDAASAGSGYTYFALGSRSRRGHNHVGSTSRFRGLLGLEVLELQFPQDHQCLGRLEPRACERIGAYLVLAFGGVESDLGGEQVGLGGGVGKVREVSGKWGACASPRRQSCHPRVSHGNTLPHAMLVRPSTSASSPTTPSTTTS